jgi:hypothetical protein
MPSSKNCLMSTTSLERYIEVSIDHVAPEFLFNNAIETAGDMVARLLTADSDPDTLFEEFVDAHSGQFYLFKSNIKILGGSLLHTAGTIST